MDLILLETIVPFTTPSDAVLLVCNGDGFCGQTISIRVCRSGTRSPIYYGIKIVPLQKTLIEMGWPQNPSPVQTYNTTTEGVVNVTIVANKLKSMDLQFHWLRCLEARNQFRFYWYKGPNNWANYITRHHPTVFHESKRTQFAGAAKKLYNLLAKR